MVTGARASTRQLLGSPPYRKTAGNVRFPTFPRCALGRCGHPESFDSASSHIPNASPAARSARRIRCCPHCCERLIGAGCALGGVNSVRARGPCRSARCRTRPSRRRPGGRSRGRIQRVAVKEVFLRVIRVDEAESAIGNDLLDCSGGHSDLQVFSNDRSLRTICSRRSRSHGATAKTRRVPTLRPVGRISESRPRPPANAGG